MRSHACRMHIALRCLCLHCAHPSSKCPALPLAVARVCCNPAPTARQGPHRAAAAQERHPAVAADAAHQGAVRRRPRAAAAVSGRRCTPCMLASFDHPLHAQTTRMHAALQQLATHHTHHHTYSPSHLLTKSPSHKPHITPHHTPQPRAAPWCCGGCALTRERPTFTRRSTRRAARASARTSTPARCSTTTRTSLICSYGEQGRPGTARRGGGVSARGRRAV